MSEGLKFAYRGNTAPRAPQVAEWDDLSRHVHPVQETREPQKPRPQLTEATIVPYLDWLTESADTLKPETVSTHLKAVELLVRMGSNEAQAKATQHTLVEQGVMSPPPNAS